MKKKPSSLPAPAGDRLEILARAILDVHGQRTLPGVLQQVTDAAREVTGARYAALGVLDPNGTGLQNFITSGLTPEEKEKIGALPRGHGVLGVLISDPRPLRMPEISRHARAYGFPPHHPPMHSFLGVPILGRQGPFGNLYLTDKVGAREFTSADETITMLLAAQAAVAIENARLHENSSRLLNEVRSMQTSRDRFFAMINHELRNALTAVYGWSELLVRRSGPDTPPAAREVFESAERTLGLLNDLLDLSRLEAARLKPIVRATDAWALIREAVATVEPTASTRDVRFEVAGPEGDQLCHTDPQRVRQILVNLLSNAVRHSPDRQVVRVELTVTETTLKLDVVDRGEGIAPEQQESIFEAFIQADSKRERGTGLGLTLSRQLARLLGGDLTVDSQPGRGSRFSIQLPRHLSQS